MAMARQVRETSATVRRRPTGDVLPALLATLASIGASAIAGFPKLAFPGSDNDSLMRLAQVRDLLAGQGWFDLHQYRMGLEGGFIMHWSRLVDAPLAGLILLLRPFVGEANAELAAQFAWPALTMAAALWFILRAARLIGGEAARFPALVLAATALHFLHIFAPGSLDHHNIQLVLILAVCALLLSGGFAAGLGAGAAAAASLAVGMETLPYVAAAGTVVALLLWLRGRDEAPTSTGFGFGLALAAAVLLLVTVRPSQWTVAACDAFSGAQAGQALLGGLGLAVAAQIYGEAGRSRRLAALAGLAVVSAAWLLIVYPQCLADPYAALDGRLKALWLDRVSEAQPLWRLVAEDPAAVALYYVTPALALALAAARLARRGFDRGMLIVGLLLATAFAVSAWQVRGASFAIALATLPLAAWIGEMRARQAAGPSKAGSLRLAGAWLASFNVVWGLAAAQFAGPAGGDAPQLAGAGRCEAATAYDGLAALPTGTVAAISNLGAPIMALTAQRALAGPYHRNIAGNTAVLDMMTATPAAARDLAARDGVDYFAVCPGNPESVFLAGQAPAGLLARLIGGEVPGWLEPAGQSGDGSLTVYRVAAGNSRS